MKIVDRLIKALFVPLCVLFSAGAVWAIYSYMSDASHSHKYVTSTRVAYVLNLLASEVQKADTSKTLDKLNDLGRRNPPYVDKFQSNTNEKFAVVSNINKFECMALVDKLSSDHEIHLNGTTINSGRQIDLNELCSRKIYLNRGFTYMNVMVFREKKATEIK